MNRQAIWTIGLAIFGLLALTELFDWANRSAPNSTDVSAVAEQSLPGSDRFIVLASWSNEAVLDRKTGLVWEKSPNTRFANWSTAHRHCDSMALGHHKGWRLPTIEELATLVDPSVPSPGPTLPPGHPFTVKSSFYWSATSDITNNSNAWGVGFDIGDVGSGGKSAIDYVWCVRDGEGLEMTPL